MGDRLRFCIWFAMFKVAIFSSVRSQRAVGDFKAVKNTQCVKSNHGKRYPKAEGFNLHAPFRTDRAAEKRWNHQRNHSQHQQNGVIACLPAVEIVRSMAK